MNTKGVVERLKPSIKIAGIARREADLQAFVRKCQIQVAKGVGFLKAKDAMYLNKIKKTVDGIKERNELQRQGLTGNDAVDLTELKKLYHGDLHTVTKEALAKEFAEDADAKIGRLISPTEEQKKYVREKYALDARAKWMVISYVKLFLIANGEKIEDTKEEAVAQPEAAAVEVVN